MLRVTFFSDSDFKNIIAYHFTLVDPSVTPLLGHIPAATVECYNVWTNGILWLLSPEIISIPIAKVSQNCVGLWDWQSGLSCKIWDIVITLKTGRIRSMGRTLRRKNTQTQRRVVFSKNQTVSTFFKDMFKAVHK